MKGNTFFMSKKTTVSNLTRAGILTSMSLVLNLIFMIYIPVAGFNSVKISLSSAITMITGIVCGPILGFFSGAVVDILSFIIKPMGPYFPAITLVAGLTGLLPALLYKWLRSDRLNYNLLNTIFIAVLSGGFVAAFIMKGVITFEEAEILLDGQPLNIWYAIGFAALAASYIIIPILVTSKLKLGIMTNKILFIVSVNQLINSILLNTYFLSVLYGKGYLFFLPARIVSSFFMIPLYTVVVATILEAVNKRFKLKL